MTIDFSQRELFEIKKVLKARVEALNRNIAYECADTRKYDDDYVSLMSVQRDDLKVLLQKIEAYYVKT